MIQHGLGCVGLRLPGRLTETIPASRLVIDTRASRSLIQPPARHSLGVGGAAGVAPRRRCTRVCSADAARRTGYRRFGQNAALPSGNRSPDAKAIRSPSTSGAGSFASGHAGPRRDTVGTAVRPADFGAGLAYRYRALPTSATLLPLRLTRSSNQVKKERGIFHARCCPGQSFWHQE